MIQLLRPVIAALTALALLYLAQRYDFWPTATCHGTAPYGSNDRQCTYQFGGR